MFETVFVPDVVMVLGGLPKPPAILAGKFKTVGQLGRDRGHTPTMCVESGVAFAGSTACMLHVAIQ